MVKSSSPFQRNRIDYYKLNNGYSDVFLRKNEIEETDEEGNIYYKSEEVYFKVSETITKELIENDFETYWEHKGEVKVVEQTDEQMLRDYVLELDMRTIMLEFGL